MRRGFVSYGTCDECGKKSYLTGYFGKQLCTTCKLKKEKEVK